MSSETEASETWRSYVVRVSVDVEDITEEQYNQLCETLCDAADALFPGVDIMMTGGIETFGGDE